MIYSARNTAKMDRPVAAALVVKTDDRGRMSGRAPVSRHPSAQEAERKMRDLMVRYPENHYAVVEVAR